MAANFLQIHAPDKLNHFNSIFLCVAYPVPHDTTPPKSSPYTGESWPQPAKDRAAMITHMDRNVGLLMEAWATGRWRRTRSSSSPASAARNRKAPWTPKFFDSSGPLRGEAGSVYEGGIRVPMIIRWPARIKPGQVSDFTCAAWDILPTAMEIAFMKPPQKTDGFSLLPVLTGNGKTNVHESFLGNRPTVPDKKPRARMIGKSCKSAPMRRPLQSQNRHRRNE